MIGDDQTEENNCRDRDQSLQSRGPKILLKWKKIKNVIQGKSLKMENIYLKIIIESTVFKRRLNWEKVKKNRGFFLLFTNKIRLIKWKFTENPGRIFIDNS